MRQGAAGPLWHVATRHHRRRAGWKVGAHALQPMRHQRRPGILGRLLAR